MAYTQYTRAQVRAMLQVRYESTPFWTDTDANLAINHALRVWNLLTCYWRRTITANNVPNDPLVPIVGTLVQQTAVKWEGRPMVGVSVAELLLLARNSWQARTSDGGLVPTRPTFWAPVGLNLIQIYPAHTAVGTLTIDGVRQTPVLTADADTIDIGPEELSTLVGYALHVCAMKAGASFLERTKPQLKAFIEAAATRNTLIKKTRWYTALQKSGYAWSMLPNALPPGAPADATAQSAAVQAGVTA